VAEERGEIGVSLATPDNIRTLQSKLYQKAKSEPKYRFYTLYDKMYRNDVLEHAYRLCRANRGASGVDGQTFEDIEAQGVQGWLETLKEELQAKTYKPAPVRRVMIPKANGGERPLGIPTIRDRVVQTAAKMLLEPIFEADFEDSAHGYRPERSARGAIEAVHQGICDGYTDVVDADLSKYFDTVPHSELMRSLARRISDKWMLKLIKSWLKVPVEERDDKGNKRMSGGKKSKTGTPQGGVISPLLANVYIHRLLRAFTRVAGRLQARIVNYADDFVILSRGRAHESLAWTRSVLRRIGLTLNEEKTRVVNAKQQPFDFLGYTFGPEYHRKDGHWYLSAKPSKKSITRIKTKIGDILRPGNMAPFEVISGRLNRLLRGWSNYFGYGTRLMAYRAVDNYVLRTTQRFLKRRHKTSGTRRWPDTVIFGELGVTRLRWVHIGKPT
jgi:RNA-directed DNA polymerase